MSTSRAIVLECGRLASAFSKAARCRLQGTALPHQAAPPDSISHQPPATNVQLPTDFRREFQAREERPEPSDRKASPARKNAGKPSALQNLQSFLQKATCQPPHASYPDAFPAPHFSISHLYETQFKNRVNAGRNGGEYYTPRPLIRAIIAISAPQLGETIYDAALGSAGFHCEAFDNLKTNL